MRAPDFKILVPGHEAQVPPDVPVEFALIDTDSPKEGFERLVRTVTERNIPCLLFTTGDGDGTMAGRFPDAERLSKPFMSDQLLSRVAGIVSRRPI